MSKKILKLEKETSSWKQRWENSHAALLEMAADKQQRDAELATTSRKLAQLQQLCRALQGERASLLAQLRGKDANNVNAGAETVEQTVNEESIKSIKQVDDLSKDCQQLKENLVQLQGSLAEAIKKEEEEKLRNKEESRSDKPEEKEAAAETNGNSEKSKEEGEVRIGDKGGTNNEQVLASNDVEDDKKSGKTNGETEKEIEKRENDEPKNEVIEKKIEANNTDSESIVDRPIENIKDSSSIINADNKSGETVSPETGKERVGKSEEKTLS